MRNIASAAVMVFGASMLSLGSASVAEAASVQQFDVGYGWYSGLTFAQPDTFRPAASAADVDAVFVPRDLEFLGGNRAPSARESRTIAAVPVPGALVLLGSGLALLGFVGRRRSMRRPV